MNCNKMEASAEETRRDGSLVRCLFTTVTKMRNADGNLSKSFQAANILFKCKKIKEAIGTMMVYIG